jgi:hypothetical protein
MERRLGGTWVHRQSSVHYLRFCGPFLDMLFDPE